MVCLPMLSSATAKGNKKGGRQQSGIWNGSQAHRLVVLIAVLAGCAIVVKTLRGEGELSC